MCCKDISDLVWTKLDNFLRDCRIKVCVAPRLRHPFRRLGNPTEECRKIGRLSAAISGPCPTFTSGNADVSEPSRTEPHLLVGNANISKTEPHRTATNSDEALGGNERVRWFSWPSREVITPPSGLLHSQGSCLLVHTAARPPSYWFIAQPGKCLGVNRG